MAASIWAGRRGPRSKRNMTKQQPASVIEPVQFADARNALRHVFVRDLTLDAHIGVHQHEKLGPQRVRVNVDLAVWEKDVDDIGQLIANTIDILFPYCEVYIDAHSLRPQLLVLMHADMRIERQIAHEDVAQRVARIGELHGFDHGSGLLLRHLSLTPRPPASSPDAGRHPGRSSVPSSTATTG